MVPVKVISTAPPVTAIRVIVGAGAGGAVSRSIRKNCIDVEAGTIAVKTPGAEDVMFADGMAVKGPARLALPRTMKELGESVGEPVNVICTTPLVTTMAVI